MAKRNNISAMPGNVANIVPSDSTDLSYDALVYVGKAGNVKITAANDVVVTFKGCSPGMLPGGNPVIVRRVWDTGTTAGNLIAMW